jgi:hypothetical protein
MTVMKLLKMENYPSEGYHIFMDIFFTTISLVYKLYKPGTHIYNMNRSSKCKILPRPFETSMTLIKKKGYFRNRPILTPAFWEKISAFFCSSTLNSQQSRGFLKNLHLDGQQQTVTKPITI